MALRSLKAIRVLIISGRPNQAVELTDAFTDVEDIQVVGVVNRPDQAIKLAEQSLTHIVLADDSVPGISPSAITRAIVAALPSISVIVLTSNGGVDEVRLSMLAGARGFLMQPFGPPEIIGTIRQIYELEAARQATTATHPQPVFDQDKKAKIITVAGLKGGVGRSIITANLAVALQELTGSRDSRVVIVDGHLGAGDIGSMLNLQPLHTLADVLARGGELDHDVIEAILTSHSSGVRVLLPATQFSGLELVEPFHLEQVMTQLQQLCDYIIVDTGPALDRTTLVMLDMADTLLVVTSPEIPSLLRTSLFLESGRSWGYSDEKLQLVLNRANNKGGVPVADVEAHLRTKVAISLPDDTNLVTYSINRGVPLAVSHKRSPVAMGIYDLARRLAGEDVAKQPAPKAGGLFGRLSAIKPIATSGDAEATNPQSSGSKVNPISLSSSGK